MKRYFNVAGPCNREDHYMINAATRLEGVEELIAQKQYFVIHAARQSGKTTYLDDLVERLNAEGKYYALYCSLEGLQEYTNPREGMPEIVMKIQDELEDSELPFPEKFAKDANYANTSNVLKRELHHFCRSLDKPLVILFDEADCLREGTLITFLRQLRDGYNTRNRRPFVHSIALVGLRSLRDYIAKVRPDEQTTGVSSPFNIVTKSMTLNNFTKEEIASLYQQHTGDTGQIFEEKAIDLVHEQTQGQPWLVNAIAREVVEELLKSDYTKPVTAELVRQAIQNIILRRDVHIDNLLEKLKEERVKNVIQPIIAGNYFSERLSDDFMYVKDLGLIVENTGRISISNPIYNEVIIRTLNLDAQQTLLDNPMYQMSRYMKEGRIDMDSLLLDFQQFWRENSEIWTKMVKYEEAAPQLVLMAFLQRVINGGGDIRREMATGTGRIDLCIVYQGYKYPVELKIRRDTNSLQKGLEQTEEYMDTIGCKEGWLAIFDQRINTEWEEKIFMEKKEVDGKTVTVVGL